MRSPRHMPGRYQHLHSNSIHIMHMQPSRQVPTPPQQQHSYHAHAALPPQFILYILSSLADLPSR